MREELEEGKAESMHNLDLPLRCSWPEGGTNLILGAARLFP